MRRLYDDGDYRGSMLVAVGCYLGLRISDIRGLRWGDLCEGDVLTMKEQKTGKVRSLKLNPSLKEHAETCRAALGGPDDEAFIFSGRQYGGSTPVSRQRASQMLSGMKKKYGIRSAKVFSTHSLRKTFGRRVWLQECKNGRGEMALMLLCDVFGHSSVTITKRYLGIRQEEILSVYDNL